MTKLNLFYFINLFIILALRFATRSMKFHLKHALIDRKQHVQVNVIDYYIVRYVFVCLARQYFLSVLEHLSFMYYSYKGCKV